MATNDWDMYNYILESKDAVRNIVEHQDEIFGEALDYLEGKNIDRIYIAGSGTSYHSAFAARKLIEDKLGIEVTAVYPMEFVDNTRVFTKNALVIGISHAGRSTSTIKALDRARELGLATIAMTAERDRPLNDHADVTTYIEIGDEFAGPKTKGFIGSIATLDVLGLMLAVRRGAITEEEKGELERKMLATTDNIPAIADAAWAWYRENAEDLKRSRRLVVLGCEGNMGAMLEGTLKIWEAVRYAVAGYELEEFMHGGYHSIDDKTYMLNLGNPGKHFERMLRMRDYFVKERGAHCFVITSEDKGHRDVDFVFPFQNEPYFSSMEYVVPLQVIARKLSLDLGIDCNIASDPDFHKKMGSYTY